MLYDEPNAGLDPEISASINELIREVQPHGPYILGGYCNGSLTAYHAARLLRAAGEQVSVLLMLNSDGSNVRFGWLKRLTGVASALRGEDEARDCGDTNGILHGRPPAVLTSKKWRHPRHRGGACQS